MSLSLADLTTPMTRAQVQASLYQVLATVGVSTTSWKPGAVARTILAGVSIFGSSVTVLIAGVAKGGFLELAELDWLTLKARYDYSVERQEATFAAGELTLMNSGGGVYLLDPDDLVASNPATGKTYRNTGTINLPAMSTLVVPIVAVEVGSASSANPGSIVELETTLLGVTCSNANALVGLDAEADPVLRTRSLEKLGALSPNGPWDAYSFVAKGTARADGSSIGVTRVRTSKDGYGNLTVYVATATGGITGTSDNPATDLGALHDALQRQAAPLAVTEHTVSATPVVVPVTYTVWMYNTSGLTPAQIQTLVADRLATFLSTQPIGGNVIGADPGKVFADQLRTVIGATRPEMFHVVLSAPAGDVVLAPSEVPVLGTVTCLAVNQVAPGAEGF